MKNQFNDIGDIITNSGEEIDMTLINDSWKKMHTEVLREIDQEDNIEDDILDMYKILIYKNY